MSLFGKDKGLDQTSFPVPKEPHHWVNGQGLGLRLQCFVAVRDAQRRIAVVRLKGNPEQWMLPGESFRPNEHPDEAARRVCEMWFGQDLQARFAGWQNYPEANDQRWYLLFLYEAHAPAHLAKPDDTEEIRFVAPGHAPGPFAMSHGEVFAQLR